MRSRRVFARITIVLLLLSLLGISGYVVVSLVRQPPTVNIEADLNQPSTALPAEVMRAGLDRAGFPGVVYDTAYYDLVAEKVQDTKDSRDIIVGVTARPIDPRVLPDVVSLGTVAQQPLLFVTRGDEAPLSSPAELVGKRVQIGQLGSVSNEVGASVLAQFGVNESNTTFLFDKSSVAASTLLDGSVDAMVTLYGNAEANLGEYFARHELHLIPTPSTKAVAGRVGYVVAGSVPSGAFSIEGSVPPQDIPVIEVPITVIAHSGVSRAAVFAIAESLRDQFGRGSVLAAPGTFPNFTNTIPSDTAAVQFYNDGITPWQYRTLPAPIADLFIPLALLSSILVILISIYQLLLPDALHLWTGVLKPRRHQKRAKRQGSTESHADH